MMTQRQRTRPERRSPAKRQAQIDRIEAKLDDALALLRKVTGDQATESGGVGQPIVVNQTYPVIIDESVSDQT